MAKTDIGCIRETNEDAFFLSEGAIGIFDRLMIVCDGMGGHEYGEVASAACVEALVKYISEAPVNMPFYLLEQAVNEANLAVKKAADNLQYREMGTTLVLCGVISNRAYIVNVGDSRLYLLNSDSFSIRQVTRDHSYVEEMVERGLMTRDSENYKKNRNVITRAIGVYAEVQADTYELELVEGDVLLLCTDGLTNMVPKNVIKNLALDRSFDLEKRAETMILEANRSGGRDNITVILAEKEEDDD